MPRWNFTQAQSKFKDYEDIISYFILVESYEKHLNSNQKSKFLNPDSIDDMINLLDDEQLKHLKSLINVFYNSKYKPYNLGGKRYLDSLSEWFKDNIYKNPKIPHFSEKTRMPIYNYCREISKKLIYRIKSVEEKILKTKKYKEELLAQYKSKLSEFGGNSVEYRQWLALLVVDHGIPDIDRIHDVTKLLRRLDIEHLKNLENKFNNSYPGGVIDDIKHIEPYLYYLATRDVEDLDITLPDHVALALDKDNSEYKAFQIALNDLRSKIEDILEEKGAYKGLVFQIKKILSSRGTNEELLTKIKELIKERGTENKELTEYINNILKKEGKSSEASLVGSIRRLIKYGVGDNDLVSQIEEILCSKNTDEELLTKIKELIKERGTEHKKLTEYINNILKEEGKKSNKSLVYDIRCLIKDGVAYIYNKIDDLKTSPMFYEDIQDILGAIGNDERYLKDAIAEYSKPRSMGSDFNDYLRKAVFLKKLAEAKVSTSNVTSFRNKMLKVREYFLRHLTSKKYTVYRGMGFDGLLILLETANPKLSEIDGDPDSLIEEINKKQPIVFDEGLVSTSLNEGIAAKEFKGKERGNVFFTIEIPAGSKALVLDYEEILNVPREEEVLLAERTKIKLISIKMVDGHYEIYAEVVK